MNNSKRTNTARHRNGKFFPSTIQFKSFTFALLIGACSAQVGAAEVEPTFPIATPADARTHGFEDLRESVRSDRDTFPRPNLRDYVNRGMEKKLAQLGKLFFFEQAAGSRGQSCASCHFHAGADSRTRNAVNPGMAQVNGSHDGDVVGHHYATSDPDVVFDTVGVDKVVRFLDFPVTEDTIGSQGAIKQRFDRTVPGTADDECSPHPDPVFHQNGANRRQVEPVNTPTVINAALSLFQFWNGRAGPNFNGANPFGRQDPDAFVLRANASGKIRRVKISIPFSSLAGQATGPIIAATEMTCGVPEDGNSRTWPEVGRKLVEPNAEGEYLVPLATQHIHPQDSLIADLRQQTGHGANVTYREMIETIFRSKWWKSERRVVYPYGAAVIAEDLPPSQSITVMRNMRDSAPQPGEIGSDTANPAENAMTDEDPPLIRFTLMHANMALFFGLAVQEYLHTLISDDTPFDRWMRGSGDFVSGFGARELAGLNVFVGKGKCANCHSGPAFTNASTKNMQRGKNVLEPMLMSNGRQALYDNGFYNIGVTRTLKDLGRGARGPTGNPLSTSRGRLMEEARLISKRFKYVGRNHLPLHSEDGTPVCRDRNGNRNCDEREHVQGEFKRAAVDGAFKVPTLRNVEWTGPYFHNGAVATLLQAVRFYNVGGFHCENRDLDPAIQVLGLTASEERNLVHFMLSLSDSRVKYRKSPFDGPSIQSPRNGFRPASTHAHEIKEVGASGNQRALQPFLGISHFSIGRMNRIGACTSSP